MFYTDRHKFIHTHNLLQYYKVGDQASVEVEGVEEQMLIFLSSLTPERVKGFWIVQIWKIPACLKFGKTSILTVLQRTMHARSEEFDATELRRARPSLETIDLRALEFGPD